MAINSIVHSVTVKERVKHKRVKHIISRVMQYLETVFFYWLHEPATNITMYVAQKKHVFKTFYKLLNENLIIFRKSSTNDSVATITWY